MNEYGGKNKIYKIKMGLLRKQTNFSDERIK